MNKYLIDYQLEDEAPDHAVVSANDTEDAIEVLKKTIISDIGDEPENLKWVETIIILDIQEV